MREKKLSVKEKCLRALMLKKGLEGYKDDYAELDELTLELKDEKGLEEFGLQVVDNFAEKNVQWGHGSVRRFELKVIGAPRAAAKPKRGSVRDMEQRATALANEAAANAPTPAAEPKPRARGKA